MEIFEKLIKDLQKIVYEYLPYEIEGKQDINYYLYFDEEEAKNYKRNKKKYSFNPQYSLYSTEHCMRTNEKIRKILNLSEEKERYISLSDENSNIKLEINYKLTFKNNNNYEMFNKIIKKYDIMEIFIESVGAHIALLIEDEGNGEYSLGH